MAQHALPFNKLLNRLKLIGVTVTYSPPAPTGWVWIFGKKGPAFPFTKGPIYPIRLRDDQELIPAIMIRKILKHLGLEQSDQAQFWNVEDHQQELDRKEQSPEQA